MYFKFILSISGSVNEILGVGERLLLAVKNVRRTQKSLAQELGIHPAAIHNVISGRNFLEFKTMAKAAKVLGVSLDWLAYGDGTAPVVSHDKEYSILHRLHHHVHNDSEKAILYMMSLVKELESETRSEIFEIVLHHFRQTIKIVVDKRKKEYQITESVQHTDFEPTDPPNDESPASKKLGPRPQS